MQTTLPDSPAKAVSAARDLLGLSQTQFGATIGRTQTVISKYESGLVNPPADVIMHCMHILSAPDLRLNGLTDSGWESIMTAMERLHEAVRAARPQEVSR
jgi:transcriptional regulator with XRE-family HTH domain